MKRKTYRTLLVIVGILIASGIYMFTYVPTLSSQQGVVESTLFSGDIENQPLIVAFGGGGGGNDWARDYLKEKRDSLINKGYAFLAIGYFSSGNTPEHLDRISLNAISDSIMNIARRNTHIDDTNIVLMGGSRGGELVLNLASRFDHFKAVIALSTSHVSFPAITWAANTSSWSYQGKEVPYVPAPFKTIVPALQGDLFTAHSVMLEDQEAVKKAEIHVENINGSVLLISGKDDDQWPATEMSNRLIERLEEHDFKHYKEHIILEGGHIAPLEQFNSVYDFLEEHVSNNVSNPSPVVNESQNDSKRVVSPDLLSQH